MRALSRESEGSSRVSAVSSGRYQFLLRLSVKALSRAGLGAKIPGPAHLATDADGDGQPAGDPRHPDAGAAARPQAAVAQPVAGLDRDQLGAAVAGELAARGQCPGDQ